MTRTTAHETAQKIGETVTVKGWVNVRRDHGGLIFIDVRDHSGVVQLVIQPEAAEAFAVAEGLRSEFVIAATGLVREREEHLKNPNLATGSVEIKVDAIEILNRAEPLPIQIEGDAMANEELRLKYRYLDLRRPKMQQMLKSRSDFYHFMRSYMEARDFTEVATPILANSSPEGARDFLIPSRVHPGKFYALPQAPQQFKQLLMVGGVNRYYQLAACFRDEDPRADRLYGEFYQLDLEMSFVDDGEEVRRTMEPLITSLVTDFAGKELVSADIPRIPYEEAMDRYGSDKPDLRYGMELHDVSYIFTDTDFAVFKNAERVKAIKVKGGAELSRKQIDTFTDIAKLEGAGGLAYIKYRFVEVREGAGDPIIPLQTEKEMYAIPESPISKFLSQTEHIELIENLQPESGDAIFFAADTRATANKVLGKLRTEFADHFGLKDPNKVALAWVVDFPFYEWDDSRKQLDFGHNPFTMPRGGASALDADDKLSIVADQYDMVMNGYEICSGGVRNHNPEVLAKAFSVLGYDEAYVEEKFGAMLSAFKFGAPPHAGCAFGVDRIFMVLTGEDNIREIVAFPKNGSGVDTMMNSPSVVDQAQLDELSIAIAEKEA